MKAKRKRDDSEGAASEVSASAAIADSTIGDEVEKPASSGRNKKKRRRKRKEPITVDGGEASTSSGQVAIAGSTNSSAGRHETPKARSAAGKSSKVSRHVVFLKRVCL